MKSNFKELLQEMTDLEPLANLVTENWDFRTRASIEATKKEAKEKLATLRSKYLEKVLSSAKLVFLAEESSDSSQESLSSNAVHVDGSALYNFLADNVERSMGPSREYGALQQMNLVTGLVDACNAVGVGSFRALPSLREVVFLKTFEEVQVFVRQLVRDHLGDELNKMHIQKAIEVKALSVKMQDDEPTIFVSGVTLEEERSSLSRLLGVPSVQAETLTENNKTTEKQEKRKPKINTTSST